MKVVLTRMVVLACVLLFGTGVHAQTPNPFVFSLGPAAVVGAVSADLNGDGRADLVNSQGTVFLANADGTFTQGMTVSIGSSPGVNCPKPTCPIIFTVLALADVNGDGKADLVLQSQYGLTYVLSGDGDGTFGAAKSSNIGVAMGAVKLVDVNRDGKLDFVGVATAPNSSNGVVFVSLGNGDGTFGSATLYLVFTGSGVQGFGTGDFNGDGKIDIVATGGNSIATGSVAVLLGNGDGTFATSATLTSVGLGFWPDMGVSDFDNDGKLDLLVSAQGSSDRSPQVYFLAGNGDGTFKPGTVVAPGSGFISIADLNGDGKEDAIVWGNPMIEVLLGKGDGTFAQNATYANGTISGSSPIAVGDFNGDGKLDVSNGATAIFGKGDGTFQDVNGGIVNAPPTSQMLTTVTTGDFNGDGKSDLAVASFDATPMVFILLGDGNGHYTLGNAYEVLTYPSTPANLQTGDFNGDGKTDLIFDALKSDGTVVLQVLLGHGDGSFGAPVTTSLGPGPIGGPAPTFQVADFNNDGFSDVATILNGELAIVIGVGDGNFQSPVSYLTATTFGVGDFNGDGKADAVACGMVGPAVLLGNGDGTLQSAIFPPPSIFGTSAGTTVCTLTGVGDFNNDGASDIIIDGSNDTPGTVELSNGDGTFSPAGGAGALPPSVKVIADINGDGNLDVVASDGVTAVLGNGDGTFATQPVSFLPPWINPLVWASYNDQSNKVTKNAVFAATNFGAGLPGIAMIVQQTPGGEISLPYPLAAPAPDFLFSATLPGVVAPGGQTTMTVKSKAIGGFNTDVALSCDGLPVGLSCGFAPPTLTAAVGQATLTLTASSGATVGTYPITLIGTAGGVSHEQQRAITIASSAGATSANLRPLTVNFSAQMIGTAATTQTATLSNAGSAALQISNVSIGGTNASDFSISSNGCGTSVAAFSNCQIVVAFSPAATGARSATLTVRDNATGGLQVVDLSGNGQDFGVGTGAGGGSATVAAGKAAIYSLSVAGSVGFNGNVSLSCSGAPTAATCAVSPATVTLSGGSASTATVTVTTTARSAVTTPVANREDRWIPSIYGSPQVVAIYATGFALLIGFLVIFEDRSRRRVAWASIAAGVLLLGGMAMSGCGGGGSSASSTGGGTTPPPSGGTATGTPAGTYTITVTATTGSGASAVSHTTNLTLVVQ